jgi:hypothetical protein
MGTRKKHGTGTVPSRTPARRFRGRAREEASFAVAPPRFELPRDYAEILGDINAFAAAWPDREIVQEPLARITWYHNSALLEKLAAPEDRVWYASQMLGGGGADGGIAKDGTAVRPRGKEHAQGDQGRKPIET